MACLEPIGFNSNTSDSDKLRAHFRSCLDQLPHYPGECPICAFDALAVPTVDADMKRLLTVTNDALDGTINLHLIASNLKHILPLSDDIGQWIATVQTALVSMQNAKAIVDLTILRHKGALHPIRSIPDDILLNIFEWCIPSGFNSLHTFHAPWTLTLVCRRWHALAVGTPHLWSNIHISCACQNPMPKFPETMLSRLDMLLSRSALCDLSVHVTAYNHRGRDDYRGRREDDVFIEECIHRLLPTAARWQKLELDDVVYGMLTPFSACIFDQLTDLHVTFREHSDTNSKDDVLRWNAPRLASVYLKRQPCAVELPWENVMSYVCDEDGLQYLPRCTSLEELWLEYTGIYPTEQVEDAGISMPITLPKLRAICLDEPKTSPHCIPKLSALLDLPSLNLLSLTFYSLKLFYPTFHGAIHLIESLFLSYRGPCSDEADPLLTFLGECSSVTDIFMDDGIADDEVLVALLCRRTDLCIIILDNSL